MSSQIEDIKSRVDVADLLGSYLKLQKSGVNFKARCPFHNERTASFFVSPARQIWHCFGCQKGGDVFKFIMEIEGCEFKEALETLAQRAGIELRRESPQVQDAKSKQFAILEEATKFFVSSLSNPIAKYLHDRGLTEETIREFRLGYAPDEWRALFNHLSSKGFRDVDVENAGLIIRKQNSKDYGLSTMDYYDRFRGRIIFPIFNQSGKVIAFGGRLFIDSSGGKSAKYVNSPETALYQKSKTLYGLHKSKIEILRENSCVLVEGYMDFLSAYQAGTKNLAAVSGTALTLDHLKILNRICEKLIVSFDMDEAGDGATKRGIDLALKDGFDVKVIKLPDGFKDPSEAISADPKFWASSLLSARHIVQFYIDSAQKKFLAGSPELSREIQRSVLPAVSSLGSDLEQAHWVREITAILNIKEEAVWNALSKIRSTKSETRNNEVEIINTEKVKTRKELLENRIVAILEKHPEFLENSDYFLDKDFYKEKQSSSRFILEAEIFLEGIADVKAEFIKCARELNREGLKEKMNLLSAKISYAEKNKKENLSSLLSDFKNLSDKINKI